MLLHADNELEPRSSRSIARVNIARTRSLSFSLTNADGLGAGVISGVISIIDLLTSADRSIGVAKVRGTRSQLDRSMFQRQQLVEYQHNETGDDAGGCRAKRLPLLRHVAAVPASRARRLSDKVQRKGTPPPRVLVRD